jgi:hypothetical protein
MMGISCAETGATDIVLRMRSAARKKGRLGIDINLR